MKCAALVNDTVGTLLSHAYQSGAAVAGAIFGTGTNGAYLEKMSAITKDIPVTGNHEYMVVNTEWGAFDNEVGLIVNPRVTSNVGLELIHHCLAFFRASLAQSTSHHSSRQQMRPQECQSSQTSL